MRQMWGIHLTVHQVEIPCGKLLYKTGKGNFGRLRAMREHRFPKKGCPQRDAVESPDKKAIGPGFDGVSKAEGV